MIENKTLPQGLQIKAIISDIEAKLDKNGNSFCRISLSGMPARYFYAFSFSLPPKTWTTLQATPHNFINCQVLITYEELPNKENQGTFCKVQAIELA